jgi:hypothetical protein
MRISQINAAMTGKAKSAPSYGRLLPRIARPAPSAATLPERRYFPPPSDHGGTIPFTRA